MNPSTKPIMLVFDLFGTLFDVNSLTELLLPDKQNQSQFLSDFVTSWRARQLDFCMRRALMSNALSFEKITRDAFITTAEEPRFKDQVQILLADTQKAVECWKKLKPYPESRLVLDALSKHYQLAVLSNGDKAQVDALLEEAKLSHFFQHVISTSILKTYKPDPLAYIGLLAQSPIGSLENCAMVSSHYWDVVGAKHVGMKAYWVQRSPERVADAWEYKPDEIAPDLAYLAEKINPKIPR